MKNKVFGFTLIELLIGMGLMLILGSFSTVVLLGAIRKPHLDTGGERVAVDIKVQQTRAMSEDSISPWGLYIQPNSYTLFRGASYSAGDLSNQVIAIESPLLLSTTFANSSVVFLRRSGEVSSFNSSANRITVTNSASGDVKNITLNALGVFDIN